MEYSIEYLYLIKPFFIFLNIQVIIFMLLSRNKNFQKDQGQKVQLLWSLIVQLEVYLNYITFAPT